MGIIAIEDIIEVKGDCFKLSNGPCCLSCELYRKCLPSDSVEETLEKAETEMKKGEK